MDLASAAGPSALADGHVMLAANPRGVVLIPWQVVTELHTLAGGMCAEPECGREAGSLGTPAKTPPTRLCGCCSLHGFSTFSPPSPTVLKISFSQRGAATIIFEDPSRYHVTSPHTQWTHNHSLPKRCPLLVFRFDPKAFLAISITRRTMVLATSMSTLTSTVPATKRAAAPGHAAAPRPSQRNVALHAAYDEVRPSSAHKPVPCV